MPRRRLPRRVWRGHWDGPRIGLSVYPAAVTPFDERERIDEASVAKLLAWFRAAGCTGAVLAGTNGEGPSLSAPEKRDLLLLGMDLAMGLKMILGITTNSITEAVWLAKQSAKAGAEAVLVMPPSYFPEATQDGIARWYERLCEEGGCPVFVYNFPKRSGVRFEPETLQRLAANPMVAGIKDSSGERDNLALYRQLSLQKQLYVGDETLLEAAIDEGWNGTISGASNVLATWICEILSSWETNNESARAKFELVLPVIRALRGVPQPGGNKAMLERLGVIKQATLRTPLSGPENEAIDALWRLVEPLHR